MKRAIVLLVMALPAAAAAEVKLPAIFGSGMVLQEGRKVPFWGTAAPGEKVTVTVAGLRAEAAASPDGRFRIDVGPVPGPGPHTVTVAGTNTVTFEDVLVGEVWVASGQSNMEWPLAQAQRPEREILAANHPRLRLFHVARPQPLVDHPVDVKGTWAPCTPESAIGFSAVGYFFGRELLQKLDKPIGIIHTSWGGTPAETWTNRKTLLANRALAHLVKPTSTPPDLPQAWARYEAELAAWTKQHGPRDPGNRGEAMGYAAVAPPPGWPTMVLPAAMESAGLNVDGVVWFRRRVALPPAFTGKPLALSLGAMGDCDTTYVDGARVGATCAEKPRHDQWPRRYAVPAEATRDGALLIAVRVYDEKGRGGLYGERDALSLTVADQPDGPALSLAGEWAYKVEAELAPPVEAERPKPPAGSLSQNAPGVLYDNMLAALIPYGIRGAIWYQGESNTRRAFQYRTLFPAMIKDWRAAWGQGDFPFLYVQLANWRPRWPGPGQRSEDEWAELREAQTLTLSLPATGMAVTIDIGDRDDIHPRNKQEVGRRLALWALARTYGKDDIEPRGPTLAGSKIEKGAVRLRFDAAQGLKAVGEPRLVGFTVAGADRQFVAAEARIEGTEVVVSAPGVDRPVAVRYAWSDNAIGNLANGAGLPAGPFRTDRWPGLTDKRK